MKLWSTATAAVATVAALALGLTTFGATAPIQNSKHNLNYTFGPNTVENNEVCLPCHAPHAQPDPTLRRLWNHVMPTNGYTLFGTGTAYASGLDEVSRKCLSCHDGTVATDSYGNIPSVSNPGGIHTGTKKFGASTPDVLGNSSTAGFIIGGNQDLRHDHPVGVAYPNWTSAGVYTPSTSFKDPSKWNTTTYISSAPTGTQNVDGTYSASYQDAAGANINIGRGLSLAKAVSTDAKGTIVGCGTCHTPHSNTYNFLRMPNVNSQLCLTCHDK